MASIRRERLFEELRTRKMNANRNKKAAFLGLTVPFGILWLTLATIYFIKGLALLAGSSMAIGQMLANMVNGRSDPIPGTYKYPYLLMFCLFVVILLTSIGVGFKKRKVILALSIFFVAAFIFGVLSINFKFVSLPYAIAIMLASIYGFWCCDFLHRYFIEMDFLSKQPGYPDFLDIFDEPMPIANTRGIYRRQYDELKTEAEKNYAHGREGYVDIKKYVAAEGGLGAMDELVTDFDSSTRELLDDNNKRG